MIDRKPAQALRERFAFIETKLLWEGGLRASDLCRAFGLSRQAAQAIITRYRRLHAGAVRYDTSSSRHVPGEAFKPLRVRGAPRRFLDYLRGEALVGMYTEQEPWSDLAVFDAESAIQPDLDVGRIGPVLAGLMVRRAVRCEYRAKAGTRWLVFSPNALVYASYRYHVRGYAHGTGYYLDLALARFVSCELDDEPWVGSDGDDEWRTVQTLQFTINPEVPEEVRKSLQEDFALLDCSAFERTMRKPVAYYVKRRMTAVDERWGKSLWNVGVIAERMI